MGKTRLGETRGEKLYTYIAIHPRLIYLGRSLSQREEAFKINERDRLKLAETKLPTSSNRGSYSRLIGKSLNLPLPKKGTDEGGDHTHV